MPRNAFIRTSSLRENFWLQVLCILMVAAGLYLIVTGDGGDQALGIFGIVLFGLIEWRLIVDRNQQRAAMDRARTRRG